MEYSGSSYETRLNVGGDSRSSKVTFRIVDIIPAIAISSFAVVWITGVSRANFWADDFIFLTSFNQNVGNLLGTDVTLGRITVNVFFFVVSTIFGISSPLPFNLFSALILFAGIGVFLKVGKDLGLWTRRSALWILSSTLATGVFYPSIFTPGMINHNAAFLFLSLAVFFELRSSIEARFKVRMFLTLLSGISWLFILVTNPLYVGLLPLGISMILHTWNLSSVLCNGKYKLEFLAKNLLYLVLPLAHFLLVSRPVTTKSSAYSDYGPQFVTNNLKIYQELLAPNVIFVLSYGLVFTFAHLIAFYTCLRKFYLPGVLLLCADSIIVLVLVQGQQVFIQYWIMPSFLLFSSMACGLESFVFRKNRAYRPILLIVLTCLIVLLPSGTNMSRYFSQEPWGYKLGQFRNEIASIVPVNSKLCVEFSTSEASKNYFLGGMAWSSGFVAPPIAAASVDFPANNSCQSSNSIIGIRISNGLNGDYDFSVKKLN
jgi:hypothetical protein